MSSIDQKTVAKIARLSRLRLDDAAQVQMTHELGKIIDWIAQLDEVDVVNIEPLASVNDMALRWREDAVTDGNKVDEVLANAPAKTADFYTVPKVIE